MTLRRYIAVLQKIRAERGERCEACGVPAHHGHHIIPTVDTGIASELVYEPANIMILCDDCHALMHPGIRNISEWSQARKGRARAIRRS